MNDQVALVVGATGGIGSACVRRLKADGYHVIALHCRVEDFDGVVAAMDAAKPHVLVCAQGHAPAVGHTLDQKRATFRGVLDTDLVGTWTCASEAARHMIPRSYGRIICLSSIHAIATYPQRAAYAAAKAGVVGLVQALAIEWAPHGITVNAVLPGQVDSPRAQKMGLDMEAILRRAPSHQIPNCDDVADAVSFLASPSSRHINGHSLVVDGAWAKDTSWWNRETKN